MNIQAISGIGDYQETINKDRKLYKKSSTDKVFLVANKNTIELRTDRELKNLLIEKYESVMQSRYFGRGGIEIVLAGYQFSDAELADLVRLSYNLS
ncbi:MmcQ/YjbR family DNA-binding protein [Candidatus Saccharibacteria bacterium]|nr:MmcQ/YjbR family DNA-binding protein [Candidatus Saccharibacteria bacterium]